jgi:predicted ATPase
VADAHSRREPFVVLIDDLHWIDRASEAFVAELAEAIDGRRILLLVNFRPKYGGTWRTGSVYQQLPLLPLGSEATRAMLDDLLGQDASLFAVRERIAERTGGNPFFIEEVMLSLVEGYVLEGKRGGYRLARPIEAVEIPTTVQVVLAARIDRLAEPDKALLQTASVIGKSFPQSILEKVALFPRSSWRRG